MYVCERESEREWDRETEIERDREWEKTKDLEREREKTKTKVRRRFSFLINFKCTLKLRSLVFLFSHIGRMLIASN